MNKYRQKKPQVVTVFIILQALTIVWVASLQVSLNIRDNGDEHNTRQLLNTTAELRFCMDNDISPCSDSSIEQWNRENPNNIFTKN